ncbi:hypothetical protein [Pseudogulbenkiania subflava]|uniref:Uncharacterized protein n=1 Tax=Pseudogulbenkiania subflava DSM 22618 TaxID=1123014 RepID=A0A1Y6CCM9_9NEIS|nr:hypothetical protein [Pseudogulbenkiania subflava]SMF54752.1 hypothetical protein SAMN02745746_03887 [Pseudogulbenkiania subflava DSM 22618]
MKTRLLALLVTLLCAQSALAGRVLPATLQIGEINAADSAQISFAAERSWLQALTGLFIPSGTAYPLAPGVRILDENNRFLLTGQLPGLVGRRVGVTVDMSGAINRIWVLTDDDLRTLARP